VATGVSIAHYVRSNQIYIDRASEKVALPAIASALAKKSGGRWTSRQVLKAIYSSRHHSKKIRSATPEEERILEELAREIRIQPLDGRSAGETIAPLAAADVSLPSPAPVIPAPRAAGVARRGGSRENYLD
jgi:hypothetical protein